MELMKEFADNHFDLAVVDPPYGSRNIQGGYTKGVGGKGVAEQKDYNQSLWLCSSPNGEYFKELKRVSKHQIIWGANHFISEMPFDSSSWVVWDKDNGNTGYADCELAYTSHNKAVRKFVFTWNGMLQGDIHLIMNRTLVASMMKTPDGTVLHSKHRHDLVSHLDENGRIYGLDGGAEYQRVIGAYNDLEDVSIYSDAPHEIIREYLTWGSNTNTGKDYKKLKDLSDKHIQAILDTQTHINHFIRKSMVDELEYRNEFK